MSPVELWQLSMKSKTQKVVGLLDNVAYWEMRAKQTRVLAEKIPHAESREAMFRIANDYERMAELAEERLKKKSSQQVG